MNYYLHRISHEGRWSHPLLKEKQLLSIGWADLAASEYWYRGLQDSPQLLESVKKIYLTEDWDPTRSHYALQRFLQMKQGDRVIVPAWGVFHVYEIADNENLVAADIEESLHNFKSWSGKQAIISEKYLAEVNGEQKNTETIDLGFFRRVKEVKRDIPRAGYADVSLTRRMKARQTNIEITDLHKSIEEAIAAFENKTPIDLRGIVLGSCAKDVLKAILEKIPPDQFEKLIKRFMESQGANAIIPSKNERDKEGDADIVATFDFLNLIIYVQAKHHEDTENDDWAVQQIKSYKENDTTAGDEFTRIAWVISTVDKFSEVCENSARAAGVRLIDGLKFAEMLLDAGMAQFGPFDVGDES